jgi:hypothetical protein
MESVLTFPFDSKINREYICKSMVKLLKWHKYCENSYGLICSVVDYVVWKRIDTNWQKFVGDPHNVRLSLTLDGVDPFGNLNSCHSPWLVALPN